MSEQQAHSEAVDRRVCTPATHLRDSAVLDRVVHLKKALPGAIRGFSLPQRGNNRVDAPPKLVRAAGRLQERQQTHKDTLLCSYGTLLRAPVGGPRSSAATGGRSPQDCRLHGM